MTSQSDTGKAKVSIVIPVFNQLHYTRNCVDSLNRASVADAQIIIVNNGSTDGTREFLAAHPEVRAIHNSTNRGCGFAWSQGARASSSTWTIVMNNDVIVPPGCIEGLMGFAEEEKFDVISPAMCEGEADYDVPAHAAEFMRLMNGTHRRDVAHGVCFMVHHRVFEATGYFDDDPRLGGYEDDEFFRRARQAGFRLAITGRSFLHHFGGTTQKSIKASLNQPNMSLGDRTYYREKTGQTWIRRKTTQLKHAIRNTWWKNIERSRHGQTLIVTRQNGAWLYR